MKHTLPLLKNACIQALEVDGDRSSFEKIVDPINVLELIKTIEGGISLENGKEIGALFVIMTNFIENTEATPQRDAVLFLVRQRFANLMH
ncbi:MAG: hypothetical protein ACRYGK_01450 [Janthinobacterium lividum]